MSSYQLRIAGATGHHHTKGTFTMLTSEAIDLAKRGYTAVLVVSDQPNLGLEVRKTDDGFHINRFNHTTIAKELEPSWLDAAEADLLSQIRRMTT